MDFKLTEEHLMIQQAARDFAQTELLPGVIERDEHSKFPTEQVKMMGELGFLGMMLIQIRRSWFRQFVLRFSYGRNCKSGCFCQR